MNNPALALTPQYLRSRMGKLCVAVTGSTAAEIVERATAINRECHFLEFRLDYLAKPLSGLPVIAEFLAANAVVTAIATCRRFAGGGRFKGTKAAEMEVLGEAAAAGFPLIDLELETAEAVKAAELQSLRSKGAALIISHHDFERTGDLESICRRIERFAPEFIKVVSTAASLSDNVTMLKFLEQASARGNVVGICMGERGLISRVLGLRAGGAFTFASAGAGEETAAGQVALRALMDTYRVDQLDAATKVYGVAGDPVRQSLSPLMLNTAFRRETVNAVYLPLQTSSMEDLLTAVRETPLHGLSVTMPFKREILKHLERTDPLSTKIGACNTVVRSQDGKLYGFNTDVAAILRPLEKRLKLAGARVLVLGAGGAARAAVFGLKDKGAEVFILNRTTPAAQKLAREAKAHVQRRDQLAKTKFDVIVNATPSGMRGVEPASILQPGEMNARLVFDFVYNPIDTPLIRAARAKGIPVITGVEMFVHQGARQFEIWTGKPAPEEEMLRVVLHALRNASGEAPGSATT